jgi:N-acetylmuramoyl-L-alanine amidase
MFEKHKVVIPYLSVNSTKKVAIDPGHGDDAINNPQVDPGSLSKDGKDLEKDWALNISFAIKERLLARNVNTLMTREGDIVVADSVIKWRLKLAHKDSCDIFVSIHLNALKNPLPYGFQVLYMSNNVLSKELAQAILNNQKTMTIRGSGLEERPKPKTLTPGVLNHFKGEAAVLVEVGFISNQQDLERIKKNYSAIGIEIADGICEYLINKP